VPTAAHLRFYFDRRPYIHIEIELDFKQVMSQFCFVLYGCGTWQLTLKEKSRLREFENRVPRRTFGPKRDEVTREWRKLHNEELYDLYSSPILFG